MILIIISNFNFKITSVIVIGNISTVHSMTLDIQQLIYTALEPLLYFNSPTKRIYWLYLLSSVVLVLLYIGSKRLNKPALKQSLALGNWLSLSSWLDIQWLVTNHIMRILLIAPVLGSQIGLALWLNTLLVQNFGAGNFLKLDVLTAQLLFTCAIFITEDFSRFLLHFTYHKVPLLWRFHAVHHSAEVLTPVTLYRIHCIELLINSCRSVCVLGTISGIFIYVIDAPITLLSILGVSIFTFLFNLAGANLRHSHIYIGFGKFEQWFVSPAQHQIHHSTAKKHVDKNFGSSLAVWDRWFGTWLPSKEHKVTHFGLHGKPLEQKFSKQLLGLRPSSFRRTNQH